MRPVVLAILDGWGLRSEAEANAVALADTPNFDRLWESCPHTQLSAHGNAVGLPEGQMGNSEVGHTNIGAGRVVWMDLPKIDNAIANGSFAENPALLSFIEKLKASGGAAHLAGLVSPGGVHAHQRHILEATKIIAAAGVPVKVHAFLDGRDVPPRSAAHQIGQTEGLMPDGAELATICGRFFAMDRDNRWDRVGEAYSLLVRGEGSRADSAVDAIEAAYAKDTTDEFMTPTALGDYAGMADGDGLFFLNFRADRAREILSALAAPKFDDFDRGTPPKFAAVLGMVEYSTAHNDFMEVMFPSEEIVNTLGSYLSGLGKKQFRIAETEKYPHVTFFLNGGDEVPAEGEARYMAPSPKVRTYDMQPEMSAAEVTEHLVEAVRSGVYDLIVVNYANPDMVGHTGDLEAAKAACAEVDRGIGKLVATLEDTGGALLLTADHGNCEVMIDPETGGPHTAHTLNPVPLILVGGPDGATLKAGGKLGDLAPSLLQLLGLPQPDEMTGIPLIEVV
ncbi:2,3-bisphosphoglycerate-independent phosphoglycerate mutase [Algicella marina]|uniref:2,3-bisphosphoglycerate-independent phosphoglycerate mutase n=1 Tax=Algicella marina TaxID=2683284 RepID=A0A6P1SZP3_9RHOB|nr:2,3-bisphosphoglycerate-independent phosphoglycerate mutase [Algicella marina]QHQ36144.1 2,3-bisphosphoglycerate-independent phosphoglycerate mutase [Algicella marina]